MIDVREIMRLLPHRYPLLMVDRVLELEPGQRAVAVKCVSANEPYFQGHFPGRPVMPGVLLVEAFAQVAAIVALSAHPDYAGQAVFLTGLDRFRFRRPVVPGDFVVMTCEKIQEKRRIWKFQAVATVDGEKAAEGEITATVVERPA